MRMQQGYVLLFGIVFIVIVSVAIVIGVATVQNAQLFMPRAKGTPRPVMTPFTSYKVPPPTPEN